MTPTNRLEIFLAMIAGREDVEPIMPMTRFEYWLNEIAAAKGGKPWVAPVNGIRAELVTIDIGNGITLPAYMFDFDLGIDEFPYNSNELLFTINGTQAASTTAVNQLFVMLLPLPLTDQNTYQPAKASVVIQPVNPDENFAEIIPGVAIASIEACVYHPHGKTIHTQMFVVLHDLSTDETYGAKDAISIDVSFDGCEEHENINV